MSKGERIWVCYWIHTHAEVALPFAPLHSAVVSVFGRVEITRQAAARVQDDLAALGGGPIKPRGGKVSGHIGAADVACVSVSLAWRRRKLYGKLSAYTT